MAQPAQEQGSSRGPAGPWMQEVRSQLPALLGDVTAARWQSVLSLWQSVLSLWLLSDCGHRAPGSS